jgi:hypothetical protein
VSEERGDKLQVLLPAGDQLADGEVRRVQTVSRDVLGAATANGYDAGSPASPAARMMCSRSRRFMAAETPVDRPPFTGGQHAAERVALSQTTASLRVLTKHAPDVRPGTVKNAEPLVIHSQAFSLPPSPTRPAGAIQSRMRGETQTDGQCPLPGGRCVHGQPAEKTRRRPDFGFSLCHRNRSRTGCRT